MKQQTAIDFLIENLPAEIIFGANNTDIINLFAQAKNIFKEQITDAYHEGLTDVIPHEYYKNTFQ
jgi:hypothetical protein